MHLDEPVNQDGPHLGVDLCLASNVAGVHMVFGLYIEGKEVMGTETFARQSIL